MNTKSCTENSKAPEKNKIKMAVSTTQGKVCFRCYQPGIAMVFWLFQAMMTTLTWKRMELGCRKDWGFFIFSSSWLRFVQLCKQACYLICWWHNQMQVVFYHVRNKWPCKDCGFCCLNEWMLIHTLALMQRN